MKKSLLAGLLLLGSLSSYAQYQLPNGDFEGGTTSYNEHGNSVPNNWNWFNTAEGELGGIAISPGGTTVNVLSYEDDPDNHYVKVVEGYFFKNVNGNLTTGMIVASDMDAGNAAKNYNYSDPAKGVGQKFSGKPDAVSFKYQVYKKSSDRVAQLNIVVHGKGRYQDPENGVDYSNIVWGKATFQSGSTDGWQTAQVDFVLGSKAQGITPAAVLASLSTDKDAGAGNKGDYIALDDLKFVYYSELASLTYDNKPITVQENMDLSDQKYDESKLSCTLTGKGATVDKSYNRVTGVLTLTVKGNDWTEQNQNQHVYTIQFEKPTPAPASEVAGTYNRWITVNMGGTDISESANNIEITKTGENTVSFSLDHFYLYGGDFGPVVIADAKTIYAEDGSIDIIAESKPVDIPNLMPLDIALIANLSKENKLTATLDIPAATVTVNVGDIPFTTSEENGILKVTGTVSKLGAASVKGESTANEIDLTGATLAEGLQTSDFSAEANNLFKIADGQSLEGNNVIKNGVCDNFVLTDGQSFNAPENFTASQITYNRVIAPSTDKDEVYTFVLPFTFTADKVNGTVYELAGVIDGVLDFTSLEGSMELKANRPYLVVSNGTQLLNASAFSGEVVATDDLTNEVIGGVAMVGAYETTSVKSEGNESWYGYNANGQFVKANKGTINPFRTAIKSTGSQSSFALKLDGTVTGIVNLENPNAKVDVYTISGVCVRKNVPAASALNGLSRGVYIVGGQKVVK